MINYVTYHDNETKDYIDSLNKAVEVVTSSPKNIISIYAMLFKIITGHNNILNHLKSSIDSCEDECEKPSECIEQIYQTAQQFRDCFVGLHKTSLNSSLFFPFRYHLENAAIDWDDFAEDCAVASDPEIRESLIRLANAI